MAVINLYKVNYHFELSGKKVGPEELYDYCQCAANDNTTLLTTLVTNNSRAYGGASLVIDSCLNIGPNTGEIT